MLGKLSGRQGAVLVRDLFKFVDEVKINICGQDILANALSDIGIDLLFVELPRFMVLLEDGTIGVNPPNLDVRILLLEVLGRATDGTTGAHTRAKVGDHAPGLLPNLWTSGVVMGLTVGEIVILVAPDAVWDLLVEALSYAVITVRMVGRHRCWAHIYLRPHCTEDVDLFLRLFVAHGANQLVPFHRTSQGKAHARIATRALDDGASRLELTIAFRRLDHAQGHTVLDTVARIEVLHLRQNRTREVGSDLVQPDHGRIANGSEDVFVDDHDSGVRWCKDTARLNRISAIQPGPSARYNAQATPWPGRRP